MRGKIIWFNVEKGHGFIRTEEDERLYVGAKAFADGCAGESRSGGRDVVFDRVAADAAVPCAADVRYVTVEEPRRARLRRSR